MIPKKQQMGRDGNQHGSDYQGQPAHPNQGGKGKGGKDNKGGGGLRYGAYGGYAGVPRKKAARFVQADISRLKRDTRSNVRQERRQFRRERGDINHVYQQSGQEMQRLKNNSAATYNQTASNATAAQAALAQTLAANSGAVQGQASSELSRLGLGGTDVGSQMAADQANSQNVAAQGSADNLANLGLAGANSAALSNLMIGSNKGQRLSDLGHARNNRDENISQLRDALHEAQAGRGDSVRALLDQMAQTGWGQHMQQAQLNLQRQAQKKNQSYNGYSSGYGYGSGGSSYSSQNYQPNYGYGYSSPSGSSYGGGGSSANRAKAGLYSDVLNMNP